MQFAEKIIAWQKKHGRHGLPWQQDADPYKIWISEIMLQQTQVSTVIPYFQRFISRFPDVETLAMASRDELLSHWSGLGYYRRAHHLHEAAQLLAQNGFSPNPHDWHQLPGVGQSTAHAIVAQAFDQPFAILDGNVKRILARYLGFHEDISKAKNSQNLLQKAQALMPTNNCRAYTQGMMDLGARVCLRKPLCQQCPVQSTCYAKQHGKIHQLPNKSPKKPPQEETWHFAWYQQAHSIALVKRQESIWHNLWCLPQIANPNVPPTWQWFHLLTHRKLTLFIHHLDPIEKQQYFTYEQALSLGLPSPIRELISQQQHKELYHD